MDKQKYFEGKKIMEAGDEILSMMGKFPVIKMSLKSAKQPDFYRAFMMLREEIIRKLSIGVQSFEKLRDAEDEMNPCIR